MDNLVLAEVLALMGVEIDKKLLTLLSFNKNELLELHKLCTNVSKEYEEEGERQKGEEIAAAIIHRVIENKRRFD